MRRWRLDYRARWKFWKVGGVCDNRLWMTTDRERGTVRRGPGQWAPVRALQVDEVPAPAAVHLETQQDRCERVAC